MGNKASKVGRSGGRVLQQQPRAGASPALAQTRIRPGTETEATDPQTSVADRLHKLGQVQVTTDERHYKPPSEDGFTMTLEARQRLEQEYAESLEAPPEIKRKVPAPTITAILQSLATGDSPEHVVRTYKIDPQILDLLKTATVPEPPKESLPNELLHQSTQAQQAQTQSPQGTPQGTPVGAPAPAPGGQRQPVRRKRTSN